MSCGVTVRSLDEDAPERECGQPTIATVQTHQANQRRYNGEVCIGHLRALTQELWEAHVKATAPAVEGVERR